MKIGIEYPKKPNLVITTAKFIPNLAVFAMYINNKIHILTRRKSRSYKTAALAFALLSKTFKFSFSPIFAPENQPFR